MTTWEDADWFDCRDSEQLSHENPVDAIVEYLDDHYEKGKTALAVIAEVTPLEVVAWKKKGKEEWLREARAYVEGALDNFVENLAEENGCPDDGEIPRLTPKVRRELMAAWEEAVVRVFQEHDVHSWSCERVEARTFDAAQLEAYLREGAPEFFREFEDDGQ